MDELVAKSVFGELTLEDVWNHVSDITEIDLWVQGHLYCFRNWGRIDDRLNFYIEDDGNDPRPEFSFKLSSKARIVENCVVVGWLNAEAKMTFFMRVPLDLSPFLPSSKKPE